VIYFIKISQGYVTNIEATDVDDLCRKVRERHGHCYFSVITAVGGTPISRKKILVA
jgi:hypothetical protein